MPYMVPLNTQDSFERFNQIVEQYQQIIENNATARCMIGFTAAAFIRNEGDIDIGLVESWLKSLDSNVVDSTLVENHVKVDRILHVVKETSSYYYNDDKDHEEVCTESEEEEEEELLEDYKLNRFTNESFCTYLPKEVTVVDHVLFPLNDQSRSWS